MVLPVSGGCACGAVRYECSAQPVQMFFCHCRNCQRATGSAFTSVLLFPSESFTFTQGEPKFSVLSGVDGRMKRGFCGDCGSPLVGVPMPEFVGIHAATLDEPSTFSPEVQFFTSHAQPWDCLNPNIPQFETLPPEE